MTRPASLLALLDELSPDLPATGLGWGDVLARADSLAATAANASRAPRRPGIARKRLLLAAGLLAVILIPLGALATVNGWWFERPLNKPVVVSQGSWGGHPWKLIAYVSAGGICWSITFEDSERGAAAQTVGTCGAIVGVRVPHVGLDLGTVDWGAGSSADPSYPNWIAGPVVPTARVVLIRLRNGTELRAPASGAVKWSNVGWYRPVRFFAAPLPATVPWLEVALSVKSITGLDGRGTVVACDVDALTNPSGEGTPLTACRR
jgi:hypothetical protein